MVLFRLLSVLFVLIASTAAAQEQLDVSEIHLGSQPCRMLSGSGSPEGAVTAPVCSVYYRTSDGAIWRKASGSGNTGWVEVSWDDPLLVSRGGTGRSSLTAGALLYGDGTSAVGLLPGGASGTVLVGTGGVPAFSADLTIANLVVSNRVGSSLIPSAPDTWDLGLPSHPWRRGHISELVATLFAFETRTLFGGYSTIGHDAGTFPTAVGAGDITINFGRAMTPGDFLEVRSLDVTGTPAVEYMRVGALVSGTTYGVTRNLSGTGAKSWAAGIAYLVLGQDGDGRIDLYAYDGRPRAIFTEQGSTYNAQRVGCVLGSLQGYYGYVSDVTGLACGSESGTNVTIDAVNGFRIRAGVSTPVHITAAGNATFQGNVSATTLSAGAGTIGGFTLGASALTATNLGIFSGAANTARVQVGSSSNIAGLNSCNNGTAIGIWAGATHSNRNSAPFRVQCDGTTRIGNVLIDTVSGNVGIGEPPSLFARLQLAAPTNDFTSFGFVAGSADGSKISMIAYGDGSTYISGPLYYGNNNFNTIGVGTNPGMQANGPFGVAQPAGWVRIWIGTVSGYEARWLPVW